LSFQQQQQQHQQQQIYGRRKKVWAVILINNLPFTLKLTFLCVTFGAKSFSTQFEKV